LAQAVAALVMIGCAPLARAAVIPVTGWAVHNGTSTVGGTAAVPTFTPADNITLMAPFDPVALLNDGDFIEGTTTLTLNDRTANTATNNLNTQLRIGLFNGPAGAVAASDIPNLGFIIEYANTALASGPLIREQTNATQVAPFVNPTNIGVGTPDANDSIQGANPGPVTLTLRLTRDGNALDLSGTISGTDSVSGNPVVGTYALDNHVPLSGTFTFNRIGLFLGPNTDATSADLSNTAVTTIPEPAALALVGAALSVGLLARRRARA
jgi:hypothetical protein